MEHEVVEEEMAMDAAPEEEMEMDAAPEELPLEIEE